MQIDFFTNFYKRVNSTLIPTTGGAGNLTERHTVTGHLKEPCSVLHPVISLQDTPVQNMIPAVCTYAYIPAFYRYYFVSDWKWENGVWTASMDVDVLASYKSHIGDSYAYIERSASDSDGTIPDKLYPAKSNFVISRVRVSSSYGQSNLGSGCFVIGIIGNDNNPASQNGGAVTYYAFTPSQMRSLMHYLLSGTFLNDAGFPQTPTANQQLLQDTVKALVNPTEYITSCMWFPCNATDIGSTLTNVTLGYYDFSDIAPNVAPAYYLNAYSYQEVFSVDIPVHPQSSTRGSYLNFSPYTRLTLHVPPFGQLPIDSTFYNSGNHLTGRINIDLITGKCQLRLQVSADASSASVDDPVVLEQACMFGVPIQIAQMTPDYLSAIGSAIRTAGAFATGYATGGVTGAIAGGLMSIPSIGNSIDAMMPQIYSEGVSGSYVQYSLRPELVAIHALVIDEDNTENGRPLCQRKRIRTLSGYIKCGEATVDYTAYKEELETIHRYLTSGFFWE